MSSSEGKEFAQGHQMVIDPEALDRSKRVKGRDGLGGRGGDFFFKPFLCSCCPLGNKHKWVPLQIDMKPEVPREKLVSRPARPPEPRHISANRAGEIKGMYLLLWRGWACRSPSALTWCPLSP